MEISSLTQCAGQPIALTKVRAKVLTDQTGVFTEIPVLLTPYGVLEPLLQYCIDQSHVRSFAWMNKLVRAVKLFLQYASVHPTDVDKRALFRGFSQRLYTGTFEGGVDRSSLCWRPASYQVASYAIQLLSEFFEYLGTGNKLNPRTTASSCDRLIDACAYQYRRDRAFLGHTWAIREEEPASRAIRPERPPSTEPSDPPAFPEDRLVDLLLIGFKVGSRYDYRNMLITLLLNGAGFRESEPFHLYTSDVVADPANRERALVFIHHPSRGAAPSQVKTVLEQKPPNRATYLQGRWNLIPRDQVLGTTHAGWKGGAHEQDFESLFFRSYWFTPQIGELFLKLWRRYLEQIVHLERQHPFAFINMQAGLIGSPYKLGEFNKAHARACKRIGLEVSKAMGTTPHGHRHAYGQRLVEAEIKPEIRRRMMHHASLQSQEVYTQPSRAKIQSELTEAAERLASQRAPLWISQLSSEVDAL